MLNTKVYHFQSKHCMCNDVSIICAMMLVSYIYIFVCAMIYIQENILGTSLSGWVNDFVFSYGSFDFQYSETLVHFTLLGIKLNSLKSIESLKKRKKKKKNPINLSKRKYNTHSKFHLPGASVAKISTSKCKAKCIIVIIMLSLKDFTNTLRENAKRIVSLFGCCYFCRIYTFFNFFFRSGYRIYSSLNGRCGCPTAEKVPANNQMQSNLVFYTQSTITIISGQGVKEMVWVKNNTVIQIQQSVTNDQ